MPDSREHRRPAGRGHLRAALRGACGPHREEAPVSRAAGKHHPFAGHRGLQSPLQELPELGDFAGRPREPAREGTPPGDIPGLARQYACQSVAYTYTEPVVFYEYTLDGCRQAHDAGLRTALVTAGYINREPFERLAPYVDAANIDLKSMSGAFYRDICEGSLAPVLSTLETAKAAGIWVEVTNLVIPTLNDSEAELRKLCQWVAANLGRETPLHFSRFHPAYRMKNLPPTPADTLDRAREIARAEGLYYVYIGNVTREDAENTYCSGCGALLIERQRYTIRENRLRDGACPSCGMKVHGIWT